MQLFWIKRDWRKLRMKNKKSTKKSILEIVPIREITENGYFRMDDGKVMELLQIQTKDVINTSADEIEYDCIKYAKFYRLYSDDLKIISLNYPCDYGQQKWFLEYKISTTKNSIYKKLLQKRMDELIWLEKNNTAREFYFMLFADTENKMDDNILTITTNIGTGKGGMVKKMSIEKKKNIVFRLQNKSANI